MYSNYLALGALLAGLAAAGCSKARDNTRDTSMSTMSAPSVARPDSTSAVPTASATAAVVMTASDARNGRHLVDESGRALYLFEKDEHGESYCDSACATAWPPYLTQDTPTAGDSFVKATLLSTIRRKDGSQQTAYNGHPLYHYTKDTGPGTTAGQDVKEFGAEWYLVAPDGKKQEGKDH